MKNTQTQYYQPDELIAAIAIREQKLNKTRAQMAKDLNVAELTLRRILAGDGTTLTSLSKVAEQLGFKVTVTIERARVKAKAA